MKNEIQKSAYLAKEAEASEYDGSSSKSKDFIQQVASNEG